MIKDFLLGTWKAVNEFKITAKKKKNLLVGWHTITASTRKAWDFEIKCLKHFHTIP